MELNDKALVIGLTGMSGAGKTTACEVFRKSGFAVIDCDKTSRRVTEAGKPALGEIIGYFGEKYLNADGTLDRRKLGTLVFSSEKELAALNGIIYPFISYDIVNEIIDCIERGCEYILLDAPTLFESGVDSLCGSVVSIAADVESCAARIEKRDGITRKQAAQRLSSQHGANFYRERSEFFIENNGTESELGEKTREMIEALKERYGGVR